MAYTFLVQLLISFLLIGSASWGKTDRFTSESYLGEKRLDSYMGRVTPVAVMDPYMGKMNFSDELYWQHYLDSYSFSQEKDFSAFFRSELSAGLMCTNEILSEHFDEIQFSYRLITLSYLIEAQWHMNLMSGHFRFKNGCRFDLQKWREGCHAKSSSMKKFLDKLKQFNPRYDESILMDYRVDNWLKELGSKKLQWYSQYRLQKACMTGCTASNLEEKFQASCQKDQELMARICSEDDAIYGLSNHRDAYYLIGISNIINTFNQRGEALGCLRRFSETMAHREVRYETLEQLFPAIQSFLTQKYQERFQQGRVYFYGSGQEFENKGLTNIYVTQQPFKLEMAKKVSAPVVSQVKAEKKEVPSAPAKVVSAPAPKKEIPERKEERKSAFLEAAEVRRAQGLKRAEVDMLKLKYDFVFSLNMINSLSDKLKTFMEREALTEMQLYDKLGTSEGPVPLLFLKYMIDMQEHRGLWNLISVLGDKFYVSNEIDPKGQSELIQLVNSEATGRQWQIYILKP